MACAELTGERGDFRAIRVIGRGGMGVVYEAVQISLNRRVALKILPMTSAEDPRKLRRFQIEAQAAALLNHPHIVPVYLVGYENGAHFYAMQLIEGQTLAEVIAEFRRARASVTTTPPISSIVNGPSPRFAAELGRQAALALQHAHEQGVLHRDVKPSNLMIDKSGRLWVADFGLARIAGEGDLSSTGALLGTPRYMSPEQVAGAREIVDHRTDVYSLGATLYELISLVPAFDSIDPVRLIVRIAHDEPRRPRAIDPMIPRDLETIVLKAMAKSPAARYPSAGALADELGRFLEGRPILARRPGALYRAAKSMRRHKPAVATAAVFLLAIVIGLGAAAVMRDRLIRVHHEELRSRLDRHQELSSALDHAERSESQTRQLLYDSQLRQAHQALASGQIELAQERLEESTPKHGERDLRGFEWHYLRRLCHRDFSVIASLDARSIIVSPDGRTLILGDRRGLLVFWDFATGRERARLQGHQQEVIGLSFANNGRALASWSAASGIPGTVKLWDPSSVHQLAAIPGMTGHVADVAFSRDDRVLATVQHGAAGGAPRNRVEFWDLSAGFESAAPAAPSLACERMAYSPDGRLLATGGSNKSGSIVTLRDIPTGQSIKIFSGSYPWLGCLAFSPDGHTLAATSKGLTLWDTIARREVGSLKDLMWTSLVFSPDGNRVAGLTQDANGIELINDVKTRPRQVFLEKCHGTNMHVAFSPDGTRLAGSGKGVGAYLWNSSSGRISAEFPGRIENGGCVVFAPGGRSLIFASDDGRIRSWHFDKKPEPITGVAGHEKEVWSLAYAPSGEFLFSAGDDHLIKQWNRRDGRLTATLTGHTALVTSLAINRQGTLLASASFDQTVRLWEIPGGKQRTALIGHTDRVRAIAFSPDGKTLASAGSDQTIRLWDASSGSMLSVHGAHTRSVRAVAFDPSGSTLVSTGDDQTVSVMALEQGRKSASLASPYQNSTLAFSPDGTVLAVGDDAGNVSFWDAATWTKRTSASGSGATIFGLAFSPDGRTLAAACGDAKVRLWDPMSGQVVLILEGHSQRVNAVAFSPDGQTLASSDHKGEIKLWHSAPP